MQNLAITQDVVAGILASLTVAHGYCLYTANWKVTAIRFGLIADLVSCITIGRKVDWSAVIADFAKQIGTFLCAKKIPLRNTYVIGVREIARRVGRNPSTVSRELTRNAATRGGRLEYRASVAQWKAELIAKRPKPSKLTTNPQLRHYVQERLEGKVRDA
jgi:hypothetical protein